MEDRLLKIFQSWGVKLHPSGIEMDLERQKAMATDIELELNAVILEEVLAIVGKDVMEFHDAACNFVDACYCTGRGEYNLNIQKRAMRTALHDKYGTKETAPMHPWKKAPFTERACRGKK